LSVGQKVRIKNGAMKDMVGILVRKKNDCRVVLNVDIIRQGVAVDIDMDEIELIASGATGLC
jgi:transcription antitermination factor NusG